MKTATILFITGLIIFPIIGLAQTSEIPVSSTQSVPTATQQPASGAYIKTPEDLARCGVYSYKFYNQCSDSGVGGVGMYKNVYTECFDGFGITLEELLCKSYEELTRLADEACMNHCPNKDVPQSSNEPPTTPAIPETAVPAKEQTQTPPTTPGASAPTTAATSPDTKCGVYSSVVSNECGAGVYKNISAQCSDGFEVILGGTSSCKPTDLWNQYAKETCTSHCFSRNASGVVSTPSQSQSTEPTPIIYNTGGDVGGGNRLTPLKPLSFKLSPVKWVSMCAISDTLMQNYNDSILELQKQEAISDKTGDKTKVEDMNRNIGQLKKYMEAQKKACAENPQTAGEVAVPLTETESKPAEIKPIAATETSRPVAVVIDRCNEVAQWENKIAYYKKLNDLNDADLKKEGFSREEIEKILQELSFGIEKVRAQCSGQEKVSTTPRGIAVKGSASILETVKPVVAESGQEIRAYYKAEIEKAVTAKGEEKQIEELKTLRDEIDGLISNLMKSRKELEVSELNALVKEVKVSRGEIKADDISVKTTEKKMLVSVGGRPVSIEPTENRVLIRDKGLEVNTNEVTIKENVLSVGGAEVKMSASEVTEKLNITPRTIELKEENTKAVYTMQIDERRKLFGFIPLNVSRALVVDAENGNTLSEQHPWYNFLTTK